MKKMTVLLLSVMMVFSMLCPVMAADTPSSKTMTYDTSVLFSEDPAFEAIENYGIKSSLGIVQLEKTSVATDEMVNTTEKYLTWSASQQAGSRMKFYYNYNVASNRSYDFFLLGTVEKEGDQFYRRDVSIIGGVTDASSTCYAFADAAPGFTAVTQAPVTYVEGFDRRTGASSGIITSTTTPQKSSIYYVGETRISNVNELDFNTANAPFYYTMNAADQKYGFTYCQNAAADTAVQIRGIGVRESGVTCHSIVPRFTEGSLSFAVNNLNQNDTTVSAENGASVWVEGNMNTTVTITAPEGKVIKSAVYKKADGETVIADVTGDAAYEASGAVSLWNVTEPGYLDVTFENKPALARISLSGNTSFYSTEIPEGTKLKVNGINTVGKSADISDLTFTYESTRPWVLDVDENGNIIDGGYDGSTVITAKSGNLEASLLFIKTSNNETTMTRGFETDISVGNQNSDAYPYQAWMDFTGALPTEATAGHDGKLCYNIPSGKSALPTYRGSWDNAANIRIGQVWFYDDGTSESNVRLYFCQVNPRAVYYDKYVVGEENTPKEGSYSYTNAWAALGLDESIHASVIKDTENGFYYYGAVGVAENGENYYFTSSKKDSGVERTKGWHQATLILDEDGTANTYIDGVLVGSEKCSKSNGAGGSLQIGSASVGYYDDMVLVSNPNTEKPADYFFSTERISLSKNKSFYSSAVPAGTKLIVEGLDRNGDVSDTSDLTYTYESTRPWVLDVDENGNIIDGGFEGSTIVTATASNGMEASLVFVKQELNGVNAHTDGLGERSSFTSKSGCMWRTYTQESLANATLVAEGGHDGGNYYQKNTTAGEDAADYGVAVRYARGSWDNEGQIRIAQGWFYDDGISEMNIYMQAAQKDPQEYVVGSGVTEAQLASWREWGLDPDLVAARPTDNYTDSFRWNGTISAAAGESVYSKKDFSVKEATTFERTPGWHQATMILEEDGSVNVYLDGEVFMTSHIVEGSTDSQFYINGSTMGKYDDFVLASNFNTTKPTVNIAVSYDEAQGSVSCNNNAVANGGKVEAYYDGSVNFTFAPAEGYELDTVTYDGADVTAFIKNGVLKVDCKNAELKVTFKEIPVAAPSVSKTMEIKTDQKVDGNPAALMYMQIQPGYGYTVKESGIVLSDKENDAQNGLKLVAKNTDDTNVTGGLFGIRVYGSALNGINCYFNPFVRYQDGEEIKTVYGEQDSFKLDE